MIDNEEYYYKEVKKLTELMRKRLAQKSVKHGDSWKKAELGYLRTRIKFLFDLWDGKHKFTDKEIIGLIDLMNQSGLLVLRLLDEKEAEFINNLFKM